MMAALSVSPTMPGDDASDQQDHDQRIREQAQTRPQQTEVAAGLD